MHKILVLLLVSVLAQSCIWKKKVWNFNILSPKNNSTIQQNSTNTITVSGNLYLEKAKLTRKDRKDLKSKFYSLSTEEQNNLREKYNNADSEEKSRFWDWLFGRPTLNGNMYCNGKKGTIRQSGNGGSWYVQGVSLSEGQNLIRCAYSDKNGTKIRIVSVNYKVVSGNEAPIANFSCDTSEVMKLSCDASASSDSDGSIAKYIYTVDGVQSESINPVASFEFTEVGIKSVALVVVDNEGEHSEEVLKVFNIQGYPSAVVDVDSSGGTVLLEGIASVNIPSNTFTATTQVTVSETKDSEVEEIYSHSNVVLNVPVRNETEVKVVLGSEQPKVDITVTLNIPSKFNLKSYQEQQFVVFARFYETSPNAELDWFHSVVYTHDQVANTLSVVLPPTAFSELRRDDGKFEAQLIIIKDQGNKLLVNKREPLPESGCSGLISVDKPLNQDRLNLTSSWSTSRDVQGIVRGHFGIDYAADVGTEVYAGFDGQVKRVKNQGDGVGYGLYVAIKNLESGMTVIYGHLNTSLVSEGDIVERGEAIALSGNTGRSTGPHLHVTYSTGFPYYQGDLRSKDKVNPEPCITVACFDVDENNYSSTVDFDPSCSSGPIRKVEWSFINGTGQGELFCSLENYSTYFSNGSYTGVMTVTDYWGHTDEYEKQFSVSVSTGDKSVPILINIERQLEKYLGAKVLPFEFNMNPSNGFEPLTVHFDASSVPSSTYVHTYKWKFGLNDEVEWCTPNYEKIFSQGNYDIEVEAKDANGDTFAGGLKTLFVYPQTGDK